MVSNSYSFFAEKTRKGMLDWNDPIIFFGMGGWWLNHQTEFLDLPRLWIGWPKSPGQWRLRCSALLPLSSGPTPLCGENHLPALCGGWGRHHPRVIGMISGNIDIWNHVFFGTTQLPMYRFPADFAKEQIQWRGCISDRHTKNSTMHITSYN